MHSALPFSTPACGNVLVLTQTSAKLWIANSWSKTSPLQSRFDIVFRYKNEQRKYVPPMWGDVFLAPIFVVRIKPETGTKTWKKRQRIQISPRLPREQPAGFPQRLRISGLLPCENASIPCLPPCDMLQCASPIQISPRPPRVQLAGFPQQLRISGLVQCVRGKLA